MAPPTLEQVELLKSVIYRAPHTLPNMEESITLADVEPVPEADDKGFRRVEGWKSTWEATVDPGWTNLIGNLHGAAAAWLIDSLSSASVLLIITPTFWGPPMWAGVTLNLNIDYNHPVPAGTRISLEVEVLKMSVTIANLKIDIRDKDTGKLLISATHLKAWRPQVAKL